MSIPALTYMILIVEGISVQCMAEVQSFEDVCCMVLLSHENMASAVNAVDDSPRVEIRTVSPEGLQTVIHAYYIKEVYAARHAAIKLMQ